MIKIQDIVYVAYSAPDLDRMSTFLEDFGFGQAGTTREVVKRQAMIAQ